MYKRQEVLCPCVESEKSYISLSEKVYKDIYKPGFDRKDLISNVYDERGSLLKVADRMKNASHFADQDLYLSLIHIFLNSTQPIFL